MYTSGEKSSEHSRDDSRMCHPFPASRSSRTPFLRAHLCRVGKASTIRTWEWPRTTVSPLPAPSLIELCPFPALHFTGLLQPSKGLFSMRVSCGDPRSALTRTKHTETQAARTGSTRRCSSGGTQAGRGVYIIVRLQDPKKETRSWSPQPAACWPLLPPLLVIFNFYFFALKDYIPFLQDSIQTHLCQEAFPNSGVPGS